MPNGFTKKEESLLAPTFNQKACPMMISTGCVSRSRTGMLLMPHWTCQTLLTTMLLQLPSRYVTIPYDTTPDNLPPIRGCIGPYLASRNPQRQRKANAYIAQLSSNNPNPFHTFTQHEGGESTLRCVDCRYCAWHLSVCIGTLTFWIAASPLFFSLYLALLGAALRCTSENLTTRLH